ncbi:hypothetical protein [Streptomyces sp. ME19-01-6]|nr:hypothetical protein [Streptomyces sp. ME19-01-6]
MSHASAYAVAHAYRQFLDALREGGTSAVPDCAQGAAARHRSIESVMTTA